MRLESRNKPGFLTADALAALVLLVVAGSALLIALSRARSGSTRLADTREAVRLAEAALTDLQSGVAPPADTPDARVVLSPCPGGRPIRGHHWEQVRASVRGQTRILIGLVPDAAPPTTRPATRPAEEAR